MSAGCHVIDVGLSTSPLLYFSVAHWGLDGGVNVTGSHNPREYNGFKLVGDKDAPVTQEDIFQIRDMIEAGKFRKGRGTVVKRDPSPDYLARLKALNHLRRPVRVVIDAGNAVAGLFAPRQIIVIPREVKPTQNFPMSV